MISATSFCAFCSRPEQSQFIACHPVNWSSTQMPSGRLLLPDVRSVLRSGSYLRQTSAADRRKPSVAALSSDADPLPSA